MSFISEFFHENKPKPKRNYIKENIKRLQEISKARQLDSLTSRTAHRHRFQNPLSEINDQIDPRFRLRKESSNLSLNQLKLKDPLSRDFLHPAGFRHQASQTIAEKDFDSLYHEGVIRFPSRGTSSFDHNKGHTKMVRTISLQTETPIRPRSPSPEMIGSPSGDTVKDFVKMNAIVLSNAVKKRQPTVDPIKPPPHYQMGMLPKYLREQKKEQEKLKEVSSADPDCPPGHTVLPEEERVKHLEELKLRYTELVSQLNSIPVRTDTLRTRRRRMEIEKELEKVETGIKLFSRDKLFIQVPS